MGLLYLALLSFLLQVLVLERLFTNYVQVAGYTKLSEDSEAPGNISQNADGRYNIYFEKTTFFIQDMNLTFLKIKML